MYRLDDYAAAEIPVLPVVRGMRAAKVQILLYIAAFIVATAALTASTRASTASCASGEGRL